MPAIVYEAGKENGGKRYEVLHTMEHSVQFVPQLFRLFIHQASKLWPLSLFKLPAFFQVANQRIYKYKDAETYSQQQVAPVFITTAELRIIEQKN